MRPADIRVRFSAEGAQQVVNALDRVRSTSARVARSVNLIAGAAGVGFSVTAFAGFIKGSIEAGSAVANFAKKTGLGAAAASELAFAANKADVSQESLTAGFKGMQLVIADAARGSEKAAGALTAVGVSVDQLRRLSPDQQFELLADAINRIEDPALRVRAAVDLFGKAGADLLPLFSQGAAGIREARREAIALGKSMAPADLARLNDADDALKRMRASVSAAAQSMTVALAPAITRVADELRKLSGGATELERIEERLKSLRGLQVPTAAALGAFPSGGTDKFQADVAKQIAQLEAQLRQARIARGVRGGRERPGTGGLVDAPVPVPTAEKKVRVAAVKDQTAEFERLFEDQRAAERAAADTRLDISRELLEMVGRERDVRIQALDEEITRRKLILATAGQLGDKEKAQLDRFRELAVAQINFDDLRAQGEAALTSLDRERTRIQQNVELGLITQTQGQNELIRIERERLVVLREMAAALLAAAQASGDQGLIAQAEQFGAAVRNIEVSLTQATDRWLEIKQGTAEALAGGFEDFFTDVITGTQSVTAAFKSMARAVIQEIARIMARQLAMKALGALSGIPGLGFLSGGIKLAAGGVVRGPGTDRSDNIPALLSPGEYVVNAAAVRRLGVDTLNFINGGVRIPNFGVQRFAAGGLVSGGFDRRPPISIINNVDARGASISRAEFEAAMNRTSDVTVARVRELVNKGRL